ncbi:hypothetical protein MRX96_006256 [Rhipicephalus microplus]
MAPRHVRQRGRSSSAAGPDHLLNKASRRCDLILPGRGHVKAPPLQRARRLEAARQKKGKRNPASQCSRDCCALRQTSGSACPPRKKGIGVAHHHVCQIGRSSNAAVPGLLLNKAPRRCDRRLPARGLVKTPPLQRAIRRRAALSQEEQELVLSRLLRTAADLGLSVPTKKEEPRCAAHELIYSAAMLRSLNAYSRASTPASRSEHLDENLEGSRHVRQQRS